MGSIFGHIFRVTSWGESHGKAIGGVIDGCPPHIFLSENDIQFDLDRRRPGQSLITTARQEEDKVEILSGVFEGKTTGTPISFIIWNKNQHSQDYASLKNLYRPQHADESYDLKYGIRDYRGGGRASARETAVRVAAGAIAKKMLSHFNIKTQIFAYTKQIQNLIVENPDVTVIEKNSVRAADLKIAKKMEKLILRTKEKNDSLGGIIEVQILDCPVGLGEPVFDKIKADFAKALLSVNAVLGFQYGAGFNVAHLKGSENNKNENGMYGGITNGRPIIMQIAVKPTSSIQLEKLDPTLPKGRHDPCLLPRAVPVIEAMCWLVIADHYLRQKSLKN
ncbi:MAG: chorismate synthase, chorismate synthase [Candidatus Peregrinibacteria bacterium GW2011_GWF2_33_10]|nr:MAG: chorismate synthase, chorismate synthase [Candidatus Peregrinibacteria bacterium GW2011_GWF2_33_10]OGJ44328.1 MAG: chorismate synthase [Candidatus Peregrinibacteria bacterium RIFOXYA2_FULL_33_21]OGJ46715.1 MAG: chorismate synthase [Candidatus Peregrinibacteria bacterium RIFOXYA12_FULL_33_12]OGJ50548.1 MAG: chorismate synthase [Candidatus Peregrinibacteria bacterium RIFOXYB2_FULL_33_20]